LTIKIILLSKKRLSHLFSIAHEEDEQVSSTCKHSGKHQKS